VLPETEAPLPEMVAPLPLSEMAVALLGSYAAEVSSSVREVKLSSCATAAVDEEACVVCTEEEVPDAVPHAATLMAQKQLTSKSAAR